MSDHYDCLGELLTGDFQKAQYILAGFGIQIAGGFICQNDSGCCRQRTGNGYSLLLTAGELIGQRIQTIIQPKCLYNLLYEILIDLATVQLNG